MLSSKLKFLGVFAFVLCISLVTGLKCYSCSSTESQEACSKSQTETNCPQGLDRCVTTGLVFSSTKAFTKSCTTKSLCDAADTGFLKNCKTAKGTTCEYKCCVKDLCNKGNNVSNAAEPCMVSILLMVVCAVVGFFR